MMLIDQELTNFALREAQLILTDHAQPSMCDSEKTIKELLAVLDRDDVVEAVDQLEDATGMRAVD